MAAGIVAMAIRKEIDIIEINPNPVIEVGNVLTNKDNSEIIIPKITKLLLNKLNKN